MSTKSVNKIKQPAAKGLDGAPCSAFRFWWEDMETGCPQLVLDNDEHFAVAVWNAAIERALLVIPGGNLCDPQETADTIRELIEPNADVELPRMEANTQTTSDQPLRDAACSPSSIYLQVFGDSEDTETPIPAESWGEIAWSKDRVFDGDVRYVRWDLVERLLTDIMAQHADPCSPWYNDCEKAGERCQWCEWASELFPENAIALAPPPQRLASKKEAPGG